MASAVMTAWWIRDTRKHFRVEHDDNEFAGRRSRVNGLSKALGPSPKRGLVSMASTGICFASTCKECEFRFDHRQEDTCQMFLKMLRGLSLSQSCPKIFRRTGMRKTRFDG